MKDYISENIIASLIDDKLSQLERLACSELIDDSFNNEVFEISKEAKNMRHHIEKFNPLRFSECERYLNEIKRHELPNNLGEIKSKNLF